MGLLLFTNNFFCVHYAQIYIHIERTNTHDTVCDRFYYDDIML